MNFSTNSASKNALRYSQVVSKALVFLGCSLCFVSALACSGGHLDQNKDDDIAGPISDRAALHGILPAKLLTVKDTQPGRTVEIGSDAYLDITLPGKVNGNWAVSLRAESRDNRQGMDATLSSIEDASASTGRVRLRVRLPSRVANATVATLRVKSNRKTFKFTLKMPMRIEVGC